jgi:hypothetical protein
VEYVEGLSWTTFKEALACVPIIEAQNALVDIRSSSFSEFKKPVRSKILTELKRYANMVKTAKSGKLMSYQDVLDMLSTRK